MYPYLWEEVFGYALPMYDLLTAVGVFAMLSYVGWRLEKQDGYTRKAANRILFFIALGLGIALLFSGLFDATFHWIADGTFRFGSITFIGGLIGGVAAFALLMRLGDPAEWRNIGKLFDTITVGILIAHGFGRLGCFCAGCCYGIQSAVFGIDFPNGHSVGAVLPTQLYEAGFLFLLACVIHACKPFKNREFATYLTAYGVFRFLLEFLRGDDRGALLGFFTLHGNVYPSPSQYLSAAMVAIGVGILIRKKKRAAVVSPAEVQA
jgi:phosphatidylglycerol:prolipoprotein diacylglycerol transferase